MKIRGTIPLENGDKLGATIHVPARLDRHVSSPGAALADVLAALPLAERAATTIISHGTLVTQLAYYRAASQLLRIMDAPVLTYDRRGRLDSAAQPTDYSIDTEVADLQALLAATGATRVLGHSFGGMVGLFTAAVDPRIENLVCYDAPVNVQGGLNHMWSTEAEEAMQAGKPGLAWALLVNRISTAGPLSKLPVPLLTQIARVLPLSGSGREHLHLLHTCLKEMRAVVENDVTLEMFEQLPTTRLFTGGFSPDYFAAAAAQLSAAVPQVEWRSVRGYFHEGPMRGDRALATQIANALRLKANP